MFPLPANVSVTVRLTEEMSKVNVTSRMSTGMLEAYKDKDNYRLYNVSLGRRTMQECRSIG